MLVNPTVEKLYELRLGGMATALAEQLERPDRYTELDFTARLGLLVDREAQDRDNRRLVRNLKTARLRTPACVEDIDFRRPRGLDHAQILALAQAGWVGEHRDLLISGATGAGRPTWPAHWPRPRSAGATAPSTGACPACWTPCASRTPTAPPPRC